MQAVPAQEEAMPSPFPGMNPYLEQEDVWHDFHERFVPHLAEVLVSQPQVREGYIVKIDEHVFIHERSAQEREFVGRADVLVAGARPAAAILEAPAFARVPVAVVEERLSFVEIRDRKERQLIAVIELLSPSNKYAGPDREQYLPKRWHILRSRAHLVEIDLLRGGPRPPLEGLPECDYCVVVSRAEERPRVGVWPLRLRDRLPVIPVPLRAPDPDARLDLQEPLHRIYDGAGYANYIYTGIPHPRLHPEDAAWARQFLLPPPA
jgi:hypothetical protein